ncbi:hypothetical protein [Dolichospermum sp. UHCC 0259]|uniref:hypothetical protein n=1 Tax=Dolichospermum sp. UHCC 0259 TaxID=2590010 RepID=UPI0014464957|nr:hypothetical protein [Dolichospermum sp. UHCC 0259]MTJ48310.1 hypothetical protein [Dolichospermum sp. UHCC 0259]
MSKWSALVYGRTYEVDFRLIAMPEYFDVQARTWAENYILATTQIPEKLSGNPRWSLFTNRNYYVIATTCMVRELFPNGTSHETKDITTDFRGRPLYAFIGYVAERDESGEFPTLPAYSDLNLEQFQLLYQKYVEQRWDVKPYQLESRQPIFTSEDESINTGSLLSSNTSDSIDSSFNINSSQDYRLLFPETEKETLWTTVINSIVQSPQHSISVCLGLSSQREAVNSPFLNATANNVATVTRIPVPVKTVAKPTESTRSPLNEPLPPTTPNTYVVDESSNDNSDKSIVSIEEFIGSLVGGIVGRFIPIPGVVIAGGIPGIILCGGIGYIAVGMLTNKGVGGVIVSKSGELLESLTSSTNTDIDNNQTQYPSSNSQRNNQTQNQNIGFKPTDNSNDELDDENQDSQKKPDNWF